MKRLLIITVVICSVLIEGLHAQSREPEHKALFNLVSQPKYYQFVDYKSQYISNHILYLAITDTRPQQERVFNEEVQWFYDDIWIEPPAKMIGKIFLKELRVSNIFKAVEMEERAPSLVLGLELRFLIGHYGKGRVAKGTVAIHATLKSAKDNRVILERDYEETSSSLVGRFTNAYRPMIIHIGSALHNVVRDVKLVGKI